MAHLRGDAAVLVFSTFRAVEIAEAYDQSPNLAKAINCEVINSEAQAPPGVVAYCVGDTKVLGTNLNWHKLLLK
jgi:hypothetical protein